MKNYLLILLIFLFTPVAFGQPSDTINSEGPHHIGLHLGATTGIGFSYRYWPKKMGFQVTGIPVFSKNSYYGSAGLSLLFKMKDNEVVDLFSYLGNHVIFADNLFQSNSVIYNIGLGIGLKIKMLDVLNLNLQAGYGLYEVNTSLRTSLAGEFGLYYHL